MADRRSSSQEDGPAGKNRLRLDLKESFRDVGKCLSARITSEAPGEGEAHSQHPPLKNSVDVALSKGANRRMSDKR